VAALVAHLARPLGDPLDLYGAAVEEARRLGLRGRQLGVRGRGDGWNEQDEGERDEGRATQCASGRLGRARSDRL
jgi:hypothetical protein